MAPDLRSSTSLSLARFIVGFTLWTSVVAVGAMMFVAGWSALAPSEGSFWLTTPRVDVRSVPVPDDPTVPYSIERWVVADPYMLPVESDGRVREVDVEEVSASVRVRPSLAFGALVAAPFVVLTGLWLWGLLLLRSLLRDVEAGSVFTIPNADRIRWIGVLVVGAAVARPAFELVSSRVLRGAIEMNGARFAVDPPSLSIGLLGLLTLVLSQVWRYGVQLQADRDLTV
jgi:hypothetical protein